MLKDIPFYGKDHEYAYKNIDEFLDIANYFNVPNVPCKSVLMRMILVTFKGAAKNWLNSIAPGAIHTWANHQDEFIQQFSPPSKVSSKILLTFIKKMASLYVKLRKDARDCS